MAGVRGFIPLISLRPPGRGKTGGWNETREMQRRPPPSPAGRGDRTTTTGAPTSTSARSLAAVLGPPGLPGSGALLDLGAAGVGGGSEVLAGEALQGRVRRPGHRRLGVLQQLD